MTAVDRENARRALLQVRTYEADQLTPAFVEDHDLGYLYCGYCADMHDALGFSAVQRMEPIGARFCNKWSYRNLPRSCFTDEEPFTDDALVRLCKRKKWIVATVTGNAFAHTPIDILLTVTAILQIVCRIVTSVVQRLSKLFLSTRSRALSADRERRSCRRRKPSTGACRSSSGRW